MPVDMAEGGAKKVSTDKTVALEWSNPTELLALCASLYDKSGAAVQIKVNNYVSIIQLYGIWLVMLS